MQSNDKLIWFDPGHGGKDTGTCHNGIVESTYVHNVSVRAADVVDCMRGYHTGVSRTGIEDPGLQERAAAAKAVDAKLAYCVHINYNTDPAVQGCTLFTLPYQTKRLSNVTAELYSTLPPSLQRLTYTSTMISAEVGVRKGDGWKQNAINVMKPYADRGIFVVLTELGFCGNEQDAKTLLQPYAQNAIVLAFARATLVF